MPKVLPEADKRKKTVQEAMAAASATYKKLKITKEMERAVIQHLQDIRALDTCYTQGSSSCTGDCPEGQHCTTTTTNNCVCVKD